MAGLNTVNSVIVKGSDMKTKLLSGMVLFMMSATAMAQQSFSTPAQATDALVTAISEQNEVTMSNLLGENWRDYLPTEGVDPDAVDRFLRDWKVRHDTIVNGDTAHLVVGDSDWQLPIPAIKTAAGWQFDMQEAAEEILTREIGRNELAAIEALHAYVDAQQSYFAMNHKYAQKVASSEGKKMGSTGRYRLAKRQAHSARHSVRKSRVQAITGIDSVSFPILTALRWSPGPSLTVRPV